MAVEERSGQTHHTGAWSLHSRHLQADVGEGEVEHPADSRQWTLFFPLASPQIPLLLFLIYSWVSPGLYKGKQSDFCSSIPVQQTTEWRFKLNFNSLQKCALHVAFHQLNLIPTKYFDPAIYHFLGLCSP